MSTEEELLKLSQQLLDSIDQQDWPTYSKLCASTLSAFEPEALGHLVEGLDFHEFYFKLDSDVLQKQSTISSPNVRLMNDSAVVTYVRVSQIATNESVTSTACEETRIWQKVNEEWQHVHFHRSIAAK
jgi:calcium/calmodulin-dependent protein kinase (CaM kinase) II